MRRFLSAVLVAAAVIAPVFNAQPASAAKAGQLCKAADVGTKADGLTCTKDGTRYRWAGGAAAATKAPTTKKAAVTTKKSTVTTKKSTVTTKASSSKATPTTKKSASTSGASAGGGDAVKGRFCAKADDGRKATDAKGRKLTCKADAAGKNRWQE